MIICQQNWKRLWLLMLEETGISGNITLWKQIHRCKKTSLRCCIYPVQHTFTMFSAVGFSGQVVKMNINQTIMFLVKRSLRWRIVLYYLYNIEIIQAVQAWSSFLIHLRCLFLWNPDSIIYHCFLFESLLLEFMQDIRLRPDDDDIWYALICMHPLIKILLLWWFSNYLSIQYYCPIFPWRSQERSTFEYLLYLWQHPKQNKQV